MTMHRYAIGPLGSWEN